ncbi:M16 family metallopeptidase [Umboniibacter marinipuniceus]|uniref:Zinc protease n=1 Tax=Umboniibacter marinipuniceus TaxID=569599 RepID=A0A3M0ABW5_9GAMM|nr:pitrilysin family protein [Umboniibacter marinipuniceus]RMA82651.1 zinc protease [Umboniibacter marinipuniceus]
MKHLFVGFMAVAIATACSPTDTSNTAANSQPSNELTLDYEYYQLDNGLNVILHRDNSDPIVAAATIIHVGSSREETGRTGFAHLFEHMAFNDSENVPRGANRQMIEELGGSRNGGTWSDGTIYYEVVPKDALEKLMWIDSDRFGYMINTVTESALEREKQVVKNEKRQRVDNQPYGHTGAIIRRALYPAGHPYSWTVIGELEDLQAATLADVREFYDRYYGPSNATLVIAGDIDIEETKALVETWFGEIPAGQDISDLAPMPVTLEQSVRLSHLDNFARLPELRITIPTVEEYHPDSYALEALAQLLADGKRAPLYRHIVEDDGLAPSVRASQNSSELAGEFSIAVRGNAGVVLDDINASLERALADFEQNGFDDRDLERIKAGLETSFYQGVSSVLNKAFQLATYAEYAGDPGYFQTDIQRIQAVSREDVLRVYNTYVKGANAVYTSVVPKASPELVLTGSVDAGIKEEAIVAGAEPSFDDSEADYERTPTVHDRSEPPLGPMPEIQTPTVHDAIADNGVRLLSIESNELPLFNFELFIPGGVWQEAEGQYGINALTASLMNEGTAMRTPAELEDDIGLLGSSLSISSSMDGMVVRGSGLARNFEATLAIASEMLQSPRFDEADFNRLKQQTLTRIQASETSPNSIASRATFATLYPAEFRAASPTVGTLDSVASIELNDVQAFYQQAVQPNNASLSVAGDLDSKRIQTAFNQQFSNWTRHSDSASHSNILNEAISAPRTELPNWVFVDLPEAKQSVLFMGTQGPSSYSTDAFDLEAAINRLGGGSSAQLFQTLRIQLGYTYGAYAAVYGGRYNGPTLAYSSVRANVTSEAMDVFRGLIEGYEAQFTDADLATTQNILIKSQTRAYESLSQKTGMLSEMARYHRPSDYVAARQTRVANMTTDRVSELLNQYLAKDQLLYVIVGDKATQYDALVEQLGEPLVLDRWGQPIQ